MRWSFKLFSVAGTAIRIHLTLVLVLVWVATAGGLNGKPDAALWLILVFGCVLLHELGHVLVALRFGITTSKIVLYPIGGIAWMKSIPKEPREEVAVALAGPAVNLFLASIAVILLGLVPPQPDGSDVFSTRSFAEALLYVNLALGLFNLLPAFPMDGGRVLRAILAMKLPYEKATAIAVRIGEVTGIAFAAIAIVAHHPVLFIVGLFLIVAASAEGAFVQREHLLEGLLAEDAAMSEFHTLRMQDSIHDAVGLILDGAQPDFPVVNDEGQCVAIAIRDDIVRVLRDAGPNAKVSDAVSKIPAQIERDVPAAEASRRLLTSGLPGAAVVNHDGSLYRWLTAENIDDLIQMRAATHTFVRPSAVT